MIEPAEQRLKDFLRRAAEAGFAVKAEPNEKVKGRYTLTASHEGCGRDYGLLGLAYHFVNRSWACDVTYTYITKHVVGLTFLECETDSLEHADATYRWHLTGSDHDNVHELAQREGADKWVYLVNRYKKGVYDYYHTARYDAEGKVFVTNDGNLRFSDVHRYALINDGHE